jgi:hypothetical protein
MSIYEVGPVEDITKLVRKPDVSADRPAVLPCSRRFCPPEGCG